MRSLRKTVVSRVGSKSITLRDMVVRAKFGGQYQEILRELIMRVIIDKLAARKKISIPHDEVQAVSDALRKSLGLQSAKDTRKWLKKMSLTEADLEAEARHLARANELEKLITDEEIRKYFTKNKTAFESVCVFHVVSSSKRAAEKVISQVGGRTSNFDEIAMKYVLGRQGSEPCGHIYAVSRGKLDPRIEADVFAARAGESVGSFKSSGKWHIIYVLQARRSTLDETAVSAIREILYREMIRNELSRTKFSIKTIQ